MFKKATASSTPQESRPAPWLMLIVDDEPEVHSITRLALSDCEYLGRKLEFINAYSAAEAMTVLRAKPDIALAFVDVVMEHDHAGLELVDHIRNELGNRAIRLILRTGQPGMAPERQVIRDFDINDYMSKTATTAGKLYTATLSALRAYHDIITLERSRQQLEHYRDGLETVITASSSLFEMRSLQQFAGGLLRQLSAVLANSQRSLFLRASGLTVVSTEAGFEVLAKAGRFDQPGVPPLESQVIDRLNHCLQERRSMMVGDAFIGYFPTKSGIVNMLYLDGIGGADEVDTKLLDMFSKNISIAFENLYLDREMIETQTDIIATLGDVVETRSNDTGNHVRRVSHLSRVVASAAGISPDDCQLLYMAAPMHDVGKVAIPDAILLKPGPLTAAEWELMKRHAPIGQAVFGRSTRPLLRAAAVIAGQHHERFDGTGYPLGLAGEQIHIFARVVALVDVFDALMHRRCYKEAWPLDRVLDEIRSQRGRQFDPVLVDAMLASLGQVMDVMARFREPEATPPEPGAELPSAPAVPAAVPAAVAATVASRLMQVG